MDFKIGSFLGSFKGVILYPYLSTETKEAFVCITEQSCPEYPCILIRLCTVDLLMLNCYLDLPKIDN